VHSDVGGSYPEPTRGNYPQPTAGLSKIALEWMLLEAEAAGLLIDATRAAIMLGQTKPLPYSFMPDFVAPDNTTDPHDSLHGLWWALELFPRKYRTAHGASWGLTLGRRRHIPPGSWIHESAVTRPNRPPLPDKFVTEPWRRYARTAAAATT
jgi:hypothetical protein